LKFPRDSRSVTPTLAALPSMSLFPFAPFMESVEPSLPLVRSITWLDARCSLANAIERRAVTELHRFVVNTDDFLPLCLLLQRRHFVRT
jgi:hypothetical protein